MKMIIINGFLGSGKTTLLKETMSEMKEKKIAVLINEFGDTSIDGKEIEKYECIKKEINQGSIFCACKFDLFVEEILKFMNMELDYIFVETSGFSNPSALDNILKFIKDRTRSFEVKIITVVDVSTYIKLIKVLPIMKKQVECADTIVLNKLDKINEDEKQKIIEEIKTIYKGDKIIESTYCQCSIEEVICGGHSNTSTEEIVSKNIDFSTCTIEITCTCINNLRNALEELKYKVFRAKGYIKTNQGNYLCEIASGEVLLKYRENYDNKMVFLYSTKMTGKDYINTVLKNNNLITKI